MGAPSKPSIATPHRSRCLASVVIYPGPPSEPYARDGCPLDPGSQESLSAVRSGVHVPRRMTRTQYAVDLGKDGPLSDREMRYSRRRERLGGWSFQALSIGSPGQIGAVEGAACQRRDTKLILKKCLSTITHMYWYVPASYWGIASRQQGSH